MTRLRALAGAAAAVLVVSACGHDRESAALLEQADAILSANRPAEALPLAKEYLLRHPDDASAHYLLGACYRAVSPPQLTLADGELETALACFERTGRRGALKRFDNDRDFQLFAHRGRALVAFAWLHRAMDRGVRREYLVKLAGQCLAHVDAGLRLDPKHAELQEMKETLEVLLKKRPPESRPAPPAPGIAV